MSNNQGKGGGEPVDDRTLLDPLNADELKALREARQRLHGGATGTPAGVSPVGPDAGEDIGDAPTRAMMAIPAFDAKGGSAKLMPDPKPLTPGAKVPTGVGLSGKVPAGQASTGQGGSAPPGGQQGQPQPGQPGFGENTLMWMSPVKAPEAKVIPERGAAAAAGMIPTEIPKQTTSRRVATGVLGVLAAAVFVLLAVVFLSPKGDPVPIELVTNPPKAVVKIDGTETSVQTPMKASLPPGPHSIEVSLEGYRTETLQIMIKEGDKPERKNIEMYPLSKPGLKTVSVSVQPVSANITIDGEVYPSRKLLRIANVDPKKPHKIEIEAGGYEKVGAEISANTLKEDYNYILKRLKDDQ